MKSSLAFVTGATVLALVAAAAPAPTPATPTNFALQSVQSGNKVKLTWSASSDQIRFTRQRLLANGNPDPDSTFSINTVNDGVEINDPDPPGTGSANFRYRIRAKQGSAYSAWTNWKTVNNIH